MAEINLKTLTPAISEIDVNFNGTLEGQADATIPLNVNLTDGVSDITPTSVALTGNDLDITIVPSGVLFKTIEPSQYTSYRTGDEGWRVQNGFFDYTPPTNPAAVAELDYTSANFFNVLKTPLVVGGVSSTTRFVDVNGIQAFSATGNANLVVIDKLTGMMYTRTNLGNLDYNTGIDFALSLSNTINGITYNDYFGTCISEINSFLHLYAGVAPNVDTLTAVTLFNIPNSIICATTDPNLTTQYFYYNTPTRVFIPITKLAVSPMINVRNARNLITAP
jgi:hypothetical protein